MGSANTTAQGRSRSLAAFVRDVLEEITERDTTLVCAGLTLYLLTAVLPLGVIVWWVAPNGAATVGGVLVDLARAFVGEEAAVWLAEYLQRQVAIEWYRLSLPTAMSLLVALYAASNFAYYLQKHLALLWWGEGRRQATPSAARNLLFLGATVGLATGVLWLYSVLKALASQLSFAPLASLVQGGSLFLLVTLFVAGELALATGLPLRSLALWRTSVVAGVLLVVSSVFIMYLFLFSRQVVGVAFAPIVVLVWLWTFFWLWFVAVVVSKRLSHKLPL